MKMMMMMAVVETMMMMMTMTIPNRVPSRGTTVIKIFLRFFLQVFKQLCGWLKCFGRGGENELAFLVSQPNADKQLEKPVQFRQKIKNVFLYIFINFVLFVGSI